MAFDTRCIGFWTLAGDSSGIIYEATPSGLWIVTGPWQNFEITNGGNTLTIGGVDPWGRVGTPATSVLGEWKRLWKSTVDRDCQFFPRSVSAETESEHIVFNSDGTYVGHWDEILYFWGYYEVNGNLIRLSEYRGTASTEGDIWTHTIDEDVYQYRYSVESDNNGFTWRDINTNAVVASMERVS